MTTTVTRRLLVANQYILKITNLQNIMKIQHELVKLWPRQGINYKLLTFELQMWPWPLTQSHERNIPTFYCEHIYHASRRYNNMAKTRYKFQDFNLWHLSVTLTFDIDIGSCTRRTYSPWRISLKTLLFRYGLDKAKITCFLTLTSKCDLWHRVMGIGHDNIFTKLYEIQQ